MKRIKSWLSCDENIPPARFRRRLVRSEDGIPPCIVEIYPRLFYGGLTKTSRAHRVEYLQRYPDLEEKQRLQASRSDDAFDAAVSALAMFDRKDGLASLSATTDETLRLEGLIWS